MRPTISQALAGLALTLVGVSTSNAADPIVVLTDLPVVNLQGGGKGVTPKGTFDMKGNGLNAITIQVKNAAGAFVDINGPVAAITANTWQIPMNMAIPVNVGVKYTFRAKNGMDG